MIKTPTGLSSFHIVDDSSDSQDEVNNLTENNHDNLNVDFNNNDNNNKNSKILDSFILGLKTFSNSI